MVQMYKVLPTVKQNIVLVAAKGSCNNVILVWKVNVIQKNLLTMRAVKSIGVAPLSAMFPLANGINV